MVYLISFRIHLFNYHLHYVRLEKEGIIFHALLVANFGKYLKLCCIHEDIWGKLQIVTEELSFFPFYWELYWYYS